MTHVQAITRHLTGVLVLLALLMQAPMREEGVAKSLVAIYPEWVVLSDIEGLVRQEQKNSIFVHYFTDR